MSGLARTAAAPFFGAAFRETLPCFDSSQRKGTEKTKASVASIAGPPAVAELSGVILAVTLLRIHGVIPYLLHTCPDIPICLEVRAAGVMQNGQSATRQRFARNRPARPRLTERGHFANNRADILSAHFFKERQR